MKTPIYTKTDNPNSKIQNAFDSLEKGTFTKLICGASNTNAEQVERLCLVYALAGIDAIDISQEPDILIAAQNGIKKAKKIYSREPDIFPDFNEPIIMVSINAGKDPHFRKAAIDFDKCVNCLSCINVCPAGALKQHEQTLKFNVNSCYGCGRCIDICETSSIRLIEKDEGLLDISNIEALEIHTGENSIESLKNFINDNISKYLDNIKLLSFSVESGRFNRDELIEYTRSLSEIVNKKVIIQIDGAAMSATNQNSSCLQAIASASILVNSGINAYIQIAGGTNHMTQKYLRLFELNISGISYGTFARKIILPFIEGFNETIVFINLRRFVNIATYLVKKDRYSGRNSV